MRISKAHMAIIIGVLASSSGCSTWNTNTTAKNPDDSWSITKMWKKEYQKPQSIGIIWSPDVLTMAGKPPTRGFGGRVYFYNERSQAIPIEGELMVHGYRTRPGGNQSEQVAADKTFGFTAEQLTSHFSPSQLGASYSIWIPWDAADGYREEITLIPTFKGIDGSIVQGTPAKLYLPGKSTELGQTAKGLSAQQVSYQKSSMPTNPGIELPNLTKPGLRTTTINLPSASAISRPQPVRQSVQAYPNMAVMNQPSAAQSVGVGGSVAQAVGTTDGTLPLPQSSGPQRANLFPAQLPQSQALPTTNPGSEVKVETLAPPPNRLQLHQLKSPIANSPWPASSSFVQPASFSR